MTSTLTAVLNGVTSPGTFVWRGTDDRDLLGEVRDAGWVALRLDTTGVGSTTEFYDAVQRDWSLPDWFGRNLDALWDVLGDRTFEPTLLVWDGIGDLVGSDPDLAAIVLGLFRDASTQAPAFCVVVRPGGSRDAEPVVSELDGLL